MGITNPSTRATSHETLDCHGRMLGWCPERTTFQMTSPEAQALLGTPDARGVAWFLAQHKMQLGWKTMDAVTVFATEESRPSVCLLFEIGLHSDALV